MTNSELKKRIEARGLRIVTESEYNVFFANLIRRTPEAKKLIIEAIRTARQDLSIPVSVNVIPA